MLAFSIIDYYKKYKSLLGVVATALAVVPLVSGLLPGNVSSFLFPPLGLVWKLIAVVLTGLVTLAVYYSKDSPSVRKGSARRRALTKLVILAVLGAGSFLAAKHFFVRELEVPSRGEIIVVSVGFLRTDFTDNQFPDKSDWEILRQRGTSEEELRNIWTSFSIFLARLSLFVSYILFLLSSVAVASMGVLYDLIDDEKRKRFEVFLAGLTDGRKAEIATGEEVDSEIAIAKYRKIFEIESGE